MDKQIDKQQEDKKSRKRIYMRNKRKSMTKEQIELERTRNREYMRKKRQLGDEEEKDRNREYMRKKRQLGDEEEKDRNREYMRKKRQLGDEEEKERNREYMRKKRQLGDEEDKRKKRNNMRIKRNKQSEEEKVEERTRKRIYMKERRLKQTALSKDGEENDSESVDEENIVCEGEDIEEMVDEDEDETSFIASISNDDVLQCVDEFQKKIQQTLLKESEKGYVEGQEIHQSAVCVVCDRCIVGTEEIHWIEIEDLKFHENVLSSDYHYGPVINQLLKEQYSIDDNRVRHLLLSPRARKNVNTDSYMCCSICKIALCPPKRRKRKTPPKFAISNGFAIGSLPSTVCQGITPVVNNLVAPVRAFNYFLTFNHGREHKITGNFTFFAQNVSENIGALTFTADVNNASCVYVMLHGSFTNVQLDIIRRQGIYSVNTFQNVYKFLHANNPLYNGLPPIERVPMPLIKEIRDEDRDDNNSPSSTGEGEEHITWKYWFPNVEEPNTINGTHESQSEFAKAIMTGETPTLIYHPSQILYNATLSELCPIAFPFGSGDVKVERKPQVSEIECLKHYLKLSLPQFTEGQFLLIVHHIFQRRVSFLTGIAKCNKSTNGVPMAANVSEITAEEIDDIITQMKNMSRSPQYENEFNSSQRVKLLLQNIRTCCMPIGYTNEAAADARNNMFSLWMTFGPPSLLFTFSPCDECSLNMQLFATSEAVRLPNLNNYIELMSSNLSLRKSLRVQYPGAAAREFDNLFQLVLSYILGWGRKGKRGIFGKLDAYSASIEEQGRTSLHAHTLIWIRGFQSLQRKLFSSDEIERSNAHSTLKDYMSRVLTTSFHLSDINVNETIIHSVDGKDRVICDGQMKGVSFPTLRKMRHRQHLKDERGIVMMCNKCSMSFDTVEFINQVVKHLLPLAKSEYPEYPIELLTIPLTTEQMDLLALRFKYDMIQIPNSATTLKKLLQIIMVLYFNTHDWKHRKSCFKKGLECRFNLPQLPCDETTISYNTEEITELVSGIDSTTGSIWYYVDGSHQKVCSYEIVPRRNDWDVFVNAHNSILANIVGYNNNVCMGSINTLYYCTLYSSKTTQDEETYPYKKALEAVSNRIKRSEINGSEDNLSSNQIGLRRLLSGINAHITSCVVSATMAWYLVNHDSRFQYSHEFKPLLLTQIEAWYNSEQIYQRIRYKKKDKLSENAADNMQLEESSNEVWFDSEINNYLYRPDHEDFNNLSIWEFHCMCDMQVIKPNQKMANDQQHDGEKKYWRFHKDHPGYMYCCLVRRKKKSSYVPKLYYRTKFPDVASLQLQNSEANICDYVQEIREIYALKALLLFMPFRKRNDLLHENSTLWTMLSNERERLKGGNCTHPHLYQKIEVILQNIQNMYNVKKLPPSTDQLLACTNSIDEFPTSSSQLNIDCNTYNNCEDEEDEEHSNLYIESLMNLINERCQDLSAFNNQMCVQQLSKLHQLRPAIIHLTPPDITLYSFHSRYHHDNLLESINNNNERLTSPSTAERNPQTLITVITQSLDVQGISISTQIVRMDTRENDFNVDLSSMVAFAEQNNLDVKQRVAFQTICASFILTYLVEPDNNCTQQQRLELEQQLYSKGACQQLLMCVTGPGGSGKSHVIKCCRMYCKLFCNAINKHFDFSVFPVTATSNSAASLLKGKTIHSAALLNNKRIAREYSTAVDWTTTRVLIIDEISMAGVDLFQKLDKNLRILTGNRSKLYGGIHVVSMGDFMQLSPVGCPPIYRKNDDLHWHGSLNAAIFLDQANHRFSQDLEWGETLRRIQIGQPTDEDLQKINERLVSACNIPDEINCCETRLVYGCFSNKRRNEITNSCFLDFILKHNPEFNSNEEPPNSTLLLKGSISKDHKDLGEDFHKFIWAMCGDNNLDADGKKVDPCLKLILGCPVMINSNTEKDRNIAKGTVGNFLGVKWKHGCQPHTEDFHGYKVLAAYVSDIECLLMAPEGEKHIVEIKPETVQINITYDKLGKRIELAKCNIYQFPLNLSLATTGHKLQGMTKDILILAEISTRTPNWLYVVLSRVTTLKGLYLTEPLRRDMFKPISRELQRELDFLRDLENRLMRQVNT